MTSLSELRQRRVEALHGEVRNTSELRRVLHLPKRGPLKVSPEELTRALGGKEGVCLFEGQTLVLSDFYEWNGILGALPVGEGKTWCCHRAPLLLGARRPVLLAPGTDRTKLQRQFAELDEFFERGQPLITLQTCRKLSKRKKGPDDPFAYWEPGTVLLVSYEEVSLDPDLLLSIDCDLLVADECHRLKNPNAACTKHVRDWRRENWQVPLMLLSGTITDRSLKDFGHLLKWTHGKVRMPLPASGVELSEWARAVDEKVEVRAAPGALSLFLPDNTQRELSDYRQAIADRIFSTPGVVRTKAHSCNASLKLYIYRPKLPTELRALIRRIESEKRGWHGEELTPAEVWRNRRGLLLGFHTEWLEPGPEEWMRARSSWKKYVRDMLEQDWPGLTSEKHIAAACKRGDLPNGRYNRWIEIKPTFKPKSRTVWHSTEILEYIIRLAKKDDVWIWVDRTPVGIKLKELTGWPYFHNHGLDGKKFVEDHRSGPAIVSVGANFQGRNLQHFHQNIITAPMTKGLKWEQLMGRTARTGQLADEVTYRLLCHYQQEDFQQALSDTDYQADFGDNKRKLKIADIIEV